MLNYPEFDQLYTVLQRLPVGFLRRAKPTQAGVVLPSHIYLPNATCLDKLKAALGRTRRGEADTKIGFPGDSTTRGLETTTSTYTNGFINKLGPKITALDPTLNVMSSGIYGHGNLTPMVNYDSRFTGTFSNGLATIGGQHLLLNAGSTLNYTPLEQWDRCDITYVRNSGIGTFSYAVDNGAATQVVGNGTPAALMTVTVSAASVGLHTLNLVGVSNGCYLQGFDFYRSDRKQIRLRNLGASSSKSTDANWTANTNVYDGRPSLRYQQNDATVIDLMINDWLLATPTTATAFKAAITPLITDNQVYGDVILCTAVPTSITTKSLAVQQVFTTAMRELADQYGCALIDKYAYFGNNDRNLAGDRGYFSDDKHLSISGNDWLATGMAPIFAL